MRNTIKAKQSLENLAKEALGEPDVNTLIIDGIIQRFEFTLKLCWKTLKRFLALERIETNTPKDTLKKAYAAGWLNNETAWLQMLQDRNEAAHIYDEKKHKKFVNTLRKIFHRCSIFIKR